MDVCAIVLAAGQGSRMLSDRPKVLHELGGAPLLIHALKSAGALVPSVTVVVTGVGGDAVAEAALAWDPELEAWRSDYYEYNSLRGGPQLAFAFRVEHRTVAFRGKVKLSVFLDLLNLRVDGSSMATQYRGGSYDPLVVPYGGAYQGLPPLPWLGLRAEF